MIAKGELEMSGAVDGRPIGRLGRARASRAWTGAATGRPARTRTASSSSPRSPEMAGRAQRRDAPAPAVHDPGFQDQLVEALAPFTGTPLR